RYPRQGLPGGVEPDLELGLAQLSRPQLRNFMRLEAPLFLLADEYRAESYPTIGGLYVAIKEAITDNAAAVRRAFAVGGLANQVGDNIGFNTFVPAPGVDPVALLQAGFDAMYSGLLLSQHNMWNGPLETLWPTFGEAVKSMMELRVLSCFTMMRAEIPPAIIADLPELYPSEFAFLARYTDLDKPVFYGP